MFSPPILTTNVATNLASLSLNFSQNIAVMDLQIWGCSSLLVKISLKNTSNLGMISTLSHLLLVKTHNFVKHMRIYQKKNDNLVMPSNFYFLFFTWGCYFFSMLSFWLCAILWLTADEIWLVDCTSPQRSFLISYMPTCISIMEQTQEIWDTTNFWVLIHFSLHWCTYFVFVL